MKMESVLKNKILELRKQGLSLRKISRLLKCSQSTVSKHCRRENLSDIGIGNKSLSLEEIKELKEYYKTHTKDQTAEKFNISATTVNKYKENKRILLSEEDKKRKNYKRVKYRRNELKLIAIEYKGGKCINCGYNKCPAALDFHHLNKDEKEFHFSEYSNIAWESLRKEIDKCVLVCANCHREIHFNEKLASNHPV